jgi:F-type H+-transporting ATPase subunit beta
MEDPSKSRGMVYGQMTEPPGAPARRVVGVDVAEVLAKAGRAALHRQHLPVHQASSVSALLERMPSAVGYQPTLLTEMGELRNGSRPRRTAQSPRCRPSTFPRTLHGPAPATTFAHLDATANLSRRIAELGIYPAVDRWRPRRVFSTRVIGRALQRRAPVKQVLQRYKDLQDIIAILGIDELSEEDKLAVSRANQVPVAALLRRAAVHRPRRQVRADCQNIRGFKEIVEGKHDHIPEQDFYLVGSIDEVLEKFKKREAA